MGDKNFKYDVFISYRQLEPDKSIAARLHTLLETYRTPRSLVSRGVARRLSRVFRDSDELAASSSLGESIESALKNSRFLVVVCSQHTPQSQWVSREIETFRQLGRGDHILPLLIEGEPENSFPGQLSDALSERAEPLAADVRASSLTSSLRKLQREKLRIIAPILAVDFAELEQREVKRRRLRAATGIALVLAIVLAIAGVWYQGLLSTQEQTEVAEAEARTARSGNLSDLARAQLDSDLSLSLLLSVEANRSALTIQSRSSLLEALQRSSGATSMFMAHGNAIQELAVSPNGEALVSAGRDEKLIVWDMKKRRLHLLLSEDDKKPTAAFAFAPTGRIAASGSGYGYKEAKLELWDSESWKRIAVQPFIHHEYIKALAFDRAGKRLVSLSSGGTINVWEMPSLTMLSEKWAGWEMLLDDHNGAIVGLHSSGELMVWNGKAFEPRDTLQSALAEHQYRTIVSAALAPDGDRLALGMFSCEAEKLGGRRNSCIIIWSLSAAQFIGEPLSLDELPADFLSFNGDGSLLASASRGSKTVHLWQSGEAKARLIDIADGAVTSLTFSQSKDSFVVGSSNGTVQVWDKADRPALGRRINKSGDIGWAASINHDGTILAAGSRNSTIVLWDLVEMRRIHESFSGHDGTVRVLAFSPGTDRLASAGKDDRIILREARTAEPIEPLFDAGPGTIKAMALSADGKKIAWWSGPYEELSIMEVATTERVVAELPKESALNAYRLRFTEGDSKIMIAARDCSLVEWDIQAKVMRDLIQIERPDGCKSIATSSALGLVAFGLENGNISLWDASSRRKIGELLRGHRDPVRTLEFLPERKALVSGDGTDIVLWDLELDSWMDLGCEIANRNFSEQEWKMYFHGETFRPTCGPWAPFVPARVVEPPKIETRPIRPSELQ